MSSLNAKFTLATTAVVARELNDCKTFRFPLFYSRNCMYAFAPDSDEFRFFSISRMMIVQSKMNGIEFNNITWDSHFMRTSRKKISFIANCANYFSFSRFPSSQLTTHDEVINYWANNTSNSQWLWDSQEIELFHISSPLFCYRDHPRDKTLRTMQSLFVSEITK